MKIKCEWCGSWINDFDRKCPNCLGVNHNYKRQSNGTPGTIEELKEWAEEKNLPLADMRTYIGEDYRGAKAFGIYKDETEDVFIVYKNKADGTRVIRYKGTDEAYAVNELYQKMRERVAQQKAHGNTGSSPSSRRRSTSGRNAGKRKGRRTNLIVRIAIIYMTAMIFISILPMISLLFIKGGGPSRGYYHYGDNSYYYYYGNWYEWQSDSWIGVPASSWMEEDYADYFDSYSYDTDSDYDSFEDSSYYVEYSQSEDDSWNDDWDSDWDSDDSWDSSWDDWDSDW